jgi:phage/conjugal plasmid C-4 type zinc finger TraR family protein
MDDADRAQRITEKLRAWAVDLQLRRQKSEGKSLQYCMDCGEEITEQRRRAQPGCKRCIACQKRHEKKW